MENNRKIVLGQVRCDGKDPSDEESFYTIVGLLYGRLYRVIRNCDGTECHWYSHEILRDPVVM